MFVERLLFQCENVPGIFFLFFGMLECYQLHFRLKLA